MRRFGFHASHEQHAPGPLLQHAIAANAAGFTAGMCSDHLTPWSDGPGQGESGFAWSWLGAALQATTMSFGTVTAPGQRYHPVVHAQAIGTLASMFPGRFWCALGSGEAINEHVTGQAWPSKPERRARLRECVDIIRALLRGETVDHRGRVHVHEAKIYVRPSPLPPLIGAALSEDSARFCGSWADGLITVAAPPDTLRKVIDAFRAGGGDGKPVYLQVAFAHADDRRQAEQLARSWAFAAVGDSEFKADTTKAAYFDVASAHVDNDTLAKTVRISDSIDQHLEWLGRDLELGIDRIYLHHVGTETGHQRDFVARFAPALARLDR